MSQLFDPYHAKLSRYRLLSAKYQEMLAAAGPDVSDQGRSVQWSGQLSAMASELRELEKDLRMGSAAELSTVVQSW